MLQYLLMEYRQQVNSQTNRVKWLLCIPSGINGMDEVKGVNLTHLGMSQGQDHVPVPTSRDGLWTTELN